MRRRGQVPRSVAGVGMSSSRTKADIPRQPDNIHCPSSHVWQRNTLGQNRSYEEMACSLPVYVFGHVARISPDLRPQSHGNSGLSNGARNAKLVERKFRIGTSGTEVNSRLPATRLAAFLRGYWFFLVVPTWPDVAGCEVHPHEIRKPFSLVIRTRSKSTAMAGLCRSLVRGRVRDRRGLRYVPSRAHAPVSQQLGPGLAGGKRRSAPWRENRVSQNLFLVL